ncbi:chemotaxis protein CheW [Ramlibacter ginsenosidimutans]|uniref:Chemotaxis protein CheW n=1 Tax=Ramlibacter ginsenosidimutans TaxID=502333 RepID=A0A934WPU9_9BURK|nr:chemotaxis protein CheW [Ramlibacter ginsenosidimutans]MBK6008705.1 chemotaxis protein CheW [Ramlibacter ginsenosidimutans]
MARMLDVELDARDGAAALPARILTTRGGAKFALSAGVTLEVIERPEAIRVPGSAPHVLGLLAWRERRIPLIDPDGSLGVPCKSTPARYALVIAFEQAPDVQVEHGALALDQLPQFVTVSDTQACDAPQRWREQALACFMLGGEAIPVLGAEIFLRHLN